MLRHEAMSEVFSGIRAPSTLGAFLRSFTWGNVLQLGKVSKVLLAELARRADLLPGAAQLAFVDVDSIQRRVYGYAKQGAAFGHTKIQGKTVLVRGLNALTATELVQQGVEALRHPAEGFLELADWYQLILNHRHVAQERPDGGEQLAR